MPEESSEGLAWLLEPPEAGQVEIYVRVGEGVELDDAQREALEKLVDAFNRDEVSGHASSSTCLPEFCPLRLIGCLPRGGGEGAPEVVARDPATGLPTGKRMHKPFT